MDDIFAWIEAEFKPQFCTSDMFIYEDMESQSGFSLPVIYQPFDGTKRWHWSDRGCMWDFLYTTNAEGKKLLDFGPGDGWPSLLLAPFVKEVVGLDASPKRVETCSANAKRLGIKNAEFRYYPAGERLPFDDNSFDAITAASSVEQSPDPKQTLNELYRVLKPGGRLRIFYESLNSYKGGYEKELWVAGLKDGNSRLILFDRRIEEEYAIQYGITVSMPKKAFTDLSFVDISPEFLNEIKSQITDVSKLKTVHPSGKTYLEWLQGIGFTEVRPTYSGGLAAAKLFDCYRTSVEASDVAAVDALIKPTVRVASQLVAPIEFDPMITAIK